MGLFDKDREFGRRLDVEFKLGEAFVLYAIGHDEPFTVPSTGEVVDRAVLTVQHLGPSGTATIGPRLEVKTIAGAIVKMATETPDEGELPAIVSLERVPVKEWDNEALVLRYVAPFGARRPQGAPAI